MILLRLGEIKHNMSFWACNEIKMLLSFWFNPWRLRLRLSANDHPSITYSSYQFRPPANFDASQTCSGHLLRAAGFWLSSGRAKVSISSHSSLPWPLWTSFCRWGWIAAPTTPSNYRIPFQARRPALRTPPSASEGAGRRAHGHCYSSALLWAYLPFACAFCNDRTGGWNRWRASDNCLSSLALPSVSCFQFPLCNLLFTLSFRWILCRYSRGAVLRSGSGAGIPLTVLSNPYTTWTAFARSRALQICWQPRAGRSSKYDILVRKPAHAMLFATWHRCILRTSMLAPSACSWYPNACDQIQGTSASSTLNTSAYYQRALAEVRSELHCLYPSCFRTGLDSLVAPSSWCRPICGSWWLPGRVQTRPAARLACISMTATAETKSSCWRGWDCFPACAHSKLGRGEGARLDRRPAINCPSVALGYWSYGSRWCCASAIYRGVSAFWWKTAAGSFRHCPPPPETSCVSINPPVYSRNSPAPTCWYSASSAIGNSSKSCFAA